MKRKQEKPMYTLMDEMLASPINPMPEPTRLYQLTQMWQGLAAIEQAPEPTISDWRVCSDAVNVMETLINMGVVEDTSGLLFDAITALTLASQRYQKGGNIRLDAAGIHAVRAVLEDYATMLDNLSERTMVRCYRQTERRIKKIYAGKKQSHDVIVSNG